MSSIDSRIVTAKFDNRAFESAAATTLNTLGKLSKAMDLGATSKAVSGIRGLSGKIGNPFGGLSSGIDGVSGKFVALASVAATALSRITNSAIDAGVAFVKQFSGFAAAQQGFAEYEQKLGSIQTILANTGLEGEEGLKKVTAVLDELNEYSDKTIYNFGEMAKNIGTFTAAGVDLETSVNSIKGIANIAALSGSNAQQASTAMYQLSQAIAAGKVGLQDWNSVVNAGMGGKVFQTALANTAVAMGVIDESALKLEGPMKRITINGSSFRESISAIGKEKWLTSDVLTNTLAQFSGDLTDAQLKAQGFNQSQIKEIRKIAQTAQDAATKVKTITQLIGTIKEALGSGWAKSFELIIGDFGQAKKLFTSMNDIIGGFIQRQADVRNKMLKNWQFFGGRDALIGGFGNLAKALINLIKPIRNAFRDVFPRATGRQLADLTKGFEKFTEKLIIGGKTMNKIRDVFKAVFTVVKIFGIVIGAVIKYVAEFFGILVSGGGGSALLAIAAAIGRVVSAMGEWLLEGDRLKNFFDSLIKARNAVLKPLVGIIGKIVEAFVALFSGDTEGFFDRLSETGAIFKQLFSTIGAAASSFGGKIADIFGNISTVFSEVVARLQEMGNDALQPLIAGFEALGDVADWVKDKLTFKMEVDTGPLATAGDRLQSVGEAAESTGGFFQGLLEHLGKIGDFIGKIGGPIVNGLGSILSDIGRIIVEFFETADFADLLSVINTAVLIGLYRSFNGYLKAAEGLFENVGDLTGSITKTFDQLRSSLKTMQNDVRANIILKIAAAIGILAVSLLLIASIPSKDLGRSLAAIAGLMTGLVGAMAVFTKFGPTGLLTLSGLAIVMVPFAAGIVLLAAAAKVMESVGWESLGKVGATMLGLAAAMIGLGFAGPAAIAGAAGLVVLAPALILMAGVIKLYEKLKTDTLKDGLTAIGAALLVLAVGAAAMVTAMPGAIALLVLVPGLIALAGVMKIFAKFKKGDIFRSLITLGGALLIIAAATNAMLFALPGAAALLVVAAAISTLAPALKLLSEIEPENIAKALLTLVGVLIILGVAGTLMAPVVTVLFGLGVALGLLGIAMFTAGAGMFLFATAFALLATTGTAGIAVLTATVVALAGLIPLIMEQIGLGIIALANVIATAGPPLVEAFTTVLQSLLRAAVKIAPDLKKALIILIHMGLQVVRDTAPDWIQTAFYLLDEFYKEFKKNIPTIATHVTDLITTFIKEVGKHAQEIIQAAADMILDFMKGISKAIDNNSEEFGRAGGDIVVSIVKGMVTAIASFAGTIGGALYNMISNAVSNINIGGIVDDLGGRIKDGIGGAIDSVLNRAIIDPDAIIKTPDFSTDLDEFFGEFQDPTITPILDLSLMKKDAYKISGLLATTPVSADTSFDRAVAIAKSRDAAEDVEFEEVESGSSESAAPTFVQHNYSPESLDDVAIYRQTNNLLSLAKGGL